MNDSFPLYVKISPKIIYKLTVRVVIIASEENDIY